MVTEGRIAAPGSETQHFESRTTLLKVQSDRDLVEARSELHAAAARMGFDSLDQACLAIIVSGLARWLLSHTTEASLEIIETVAPGNRILEFRAAWSIEKGMATVSPFIRGEFYLDGVAVQESGDRASVKLTKRLRAAWLDTVVA
jgi:hypothetical protein